MHERTRDGDALHLPSRKLVREAVTKFVKFYPMQSFAHSFTGIAISREQERQLNVFYDRQCVQQLKGLKNESHFSSAKLSQFRVTKH